MRTGLPLRIVSRVTTRVQYLWRKWVTGSGPMEAWHFEGGLFYHSHTLCQDAMVILLRGIEPGATFACVPGTGGKPHCPTCAAI